MDECKPLPPPSFLGILNPPPPPDLRVANGRSPSESSSSSNTAAFRLAPALALAGDFALAPPLM